MSIILLTLERTEKKLIERYSLEVSTGLSMSS